jgi:hypothetical protein
MKLNSAIRGSGCVALAVLSLAGCAASDELSLLRYRVYELEAELSVMNEGLKESQKVLHVSLVDLELEMQARLFENSRLIAELEDKSEKFDIFSDDGNFLIGSTPAASRSKLSTAPNSYQVQRLSDINFWKSSGGRHSGAVGNKKYLLTVAEAGSASIKLISEEANTYLHLFDGSGAQVSKDDDSAEGNNALIQMYLDPGNYMVVAATFDEGVSAGFALTVSGIDAVLVRL